LPISPFFYISIPTVEEWGHLRQHDTFNQENYYAPLDSELKKAKTSEKTSKKSASMLARR